MLIFRRISNGCFRKIFIKHTDAHGLACRQLSLIPSLYDGEQDPAIKFFSPNVQKLLKRITRPDFAKVFRKRTNSGYTVLRTPKYKFLTNDELENEISKANIKADKLLQMPPVVKIHQSINEVLSKDPALVGYDTSALFFTDITFGVRNEERIIVERDMDGTLRSCDHDVRKRLNQVYFPINGRKIKEPLMFTDEEKFNSLLEREEYEYVLDRACIQYEPDEPSYQRLTSITYQHVEATKKFNLLRSTRHFGPLVFYLTWHQNIDSLMLELIQTGMVREAVLLVAVRQAIQEDVADRNMAEVLATEIFPTPILLHKLDHITQEDVQLDNKCVECIEKYIVSNSAMKSQQELALQGFREYYQQLIEMSQGLQKAHGNL